MTIPEAVVVDPGTPLDETAEAQAATAVAAVAALDPGDPIRVAVEALAAAIPT